jgi:hypothetical protein
VAGAGFHSIAKLRAEIFNPVLADRGVYSADCHKEKGHTADCQSQESEFESGLPQAWTLRIVRIRPQTVWQWSKLTQPISWYYTFKCLGTCLSKRPKLPFLPKSLEIIMFPLIEIFCYLLNFHIPFKLNEYNQFEMIRTWKVYFWPACFPDYASLFI